MRSSQFGARLTIEGRGAARSVTRLFERWNLSLNDQITLLGLSREGIDALMNGQMDVDRVHLERMSLLLKIHRCLRLLFPHDRALAYAWMSRPNKAFEGHSPIEEIRRLGFAGMLSIAEYLASACHE